MRVSFAKCPQAQTRLVQRQTLTPLLADRVARVQLETDDRLAAILLKLGLLSERLLAEELAAYCELPRLDTSSLPSQAPAIADLNAEFLRNHEVVPLRVTDQSVEVACWDTLDEVVVPALRFAVDLPVARFVGTRHEVSQALATLYVRDSSQDSDDTRGSALVEDEEVDRLKDLASDAPVIRLVQIRASSIRLRLTRTMPTEMC